MTAARAKTHWADRWLPLALPIVFQTLGFVWYASHLNAQVAQNAKDIAALNISVVPRPEYQAAMDATKDQLKEINGKLDDLLLASRGKQ